MERIPSGTELTAFLRGWMEALPVSFPQTGEMTEPRLLGCLQETLTWPEGRSLVPRSSFRRLCVRGAGIVSRTGGRGARSGLGCFHPQGSEGQMRKSRSPWETQKAALRVNVQFGGEEKAPGQPSSPRTNESRRSPPSPRGSKRRRARPPPSQGLSSRPNAAFVSVSAPPLPSHSGPGTEGASGWFFAGSLIAEPSGSSPAVQGQVLRWQAERRLVSWGRRCFHFPASARVSWLLRWARSSRPKWLGKRPTASPELGLCLPFKRRPSRFRKPNRLLEKSARLLLPLAGSQVQRQRVRDPSRPISTYLLWRAAAAGGRRRAARKPISERPRRPAPSGDDARRRPGPPLSRGQRRRRRRRALLRGGRAA